MSRSRTRRIAKWTGVVVCGLIAVTWILTLFWGVGYVGDTKTIGVVKGWAGLLVQPPNPGVHVGWVGHPGSDADVRWWPSLWSSRPTSQWQLAIPLWIPLLAIAIPTAWLWRRDRRHPPAHCPRCGYDLTGNVTGVCSECGTTKIEAER